jgi:uncharacterized membrane protein YfcA
MLQHVLFFVMVFAAEVLGTVAGFGSSVFFVPLAAFFFGMQTVLALTGVLHVFSNAAKLLLFGRHIDYRLLLLLGLPGLILVIAGAWLSTRIDLTYTGLILGGFLMVFSALLYAFPRAQIAATESNAVVFGGLAGFLAGLVGTGGAIRGLTLAAFNLEKNAFIGTSAAIDFGIDLSRVSIYLKNSFLPPELYPYIPMLFLTALMGAYVGRTLLRAVDQAYFRKIVLLLIFGIGSFTLAQFIYHSTR